jgi:pyruvate formate lyase activating enzyme
MNIAAVEKFSLLDYPNKISAIVFTQGCNYDCFYCHNRSLIEFKENENYNSTLSFLEKRKNQLEAVVISGGEPTMQLALKSFIGEVKNLGYLVKLDTNGSNPLILKELIDNKLLDYVALDVKAVWANYKSICSKGANWEKVNSSLQILKETFDDWEVRTTIYPNLSINNLEVIKRQIGKVPLWRLNVYREPSDYKNENQVKIKGRYLNKEELEKWALSTKTKVTIN